jgi:hypothetical protein
MEGVQMGVSGMGTSLLPDMQNASNRTDGLYDPAVGVVLVKMTGKLKPPTFVVEGGGSTCSTAIRVSVFNFPNMDPT